jgi:hypothetical protein
MTLCCVTALKPFSFETHMFEKQRKCNKQKIQCFVDEYEIYFTRETGFLYLRNDSNFLADYTI